MAPHGRGAAPRLRALAGRRRRYRVGMPDRLRRYRAKRDAGATPEPAGAAAGGAAAGGAPRFVVQEHHASSLHWDLRLEHDGVLASWAVPKGIPPDPRTNHLAVRTEDHPLEYLGFAGEIPAGQYGAGTMAIWDRGTFDPEKFRDDEVIATFHGERMRGRYALFQTKGDTRETRPSMMREWQLDHVRPVSKGGDDLRSNRQVLCRKCNRDKSSN